MLFGDPDIEHPVGKSCLHLVEAGSGRHRRGDGDNPVIGFGGRHQTLREDRGVARRVAGGLLLRSGDDVEFRHRMVFLGRRTRKRMPLALLRHHMDQNRAARVAVANVLQHRQQMRHVMAVNRADVKKTKLAEHRIAADQVARRFTGAPRRALDLGREPACHLAHQVADRMEGFGGNQPREIAAHRADRLRDRHVIVVQYDDQARIRCTCIVHALESHAGTHRAVADHRYDVSLLAGEITPHRHAKTGRNRGRGMTGTERVELGFASFCEAGKPVLLAKRLDLFPAAGKDLVRIGLMADIPDQPVMRGLEHVMKRHGKLDDPEPGTEMAARFRYGANRRVAEFGGETLQLAFGKAAQIVHILDHVEQGSCCHSRVGPLGRAGLSTTLRTDIRTITTAVQ